MARNFRVLVLILIFILTLSACSSPKGAYVTSKDDYEYSNPADADEAQFAAGENSMMVRQVIYQVVLKVSVSDVDKTVEVLKERAAELGGYVSNSVRETHNNKPTARITFRIPQAQYPQFLDFARDQGEPGSETLNSLDVTEEFVDLEARLANGRLHEERLLAMLAQTGTVTELLSVEKELARIRENIDGQSGNTPGRTARRDRYPRTQTGGFPGNPPPLPKGIGKKLNLFPGCYQLSVYCPRRPFALCHSCSSGVMVNYLSAAQKQKC